MNQHSSSSPVGLDYYPNLIDDDLSNRLTDFLQSEQFNKELFPVTKLRTGEISPKSRMVAQYGYRYDYTSGSTNQKTTPIPQLLLELRNLIKVDDSIDFDQCIINRYLPGQGIGGHFDRLTYGPVIACFTLGSGAEMEFINEGESYKLYTEANLLYIMSCEARYKWLHLMRSRKSDPGHGKRGIRWSITYRSVTSKS